MMCNVNIKCIICDTLNRYSFEIKIYDDCNHLLVNKCTNKFGVLSVKLFKKGLYKIIIKTKCFLYPNYICKKIFINKTNNQFTFNFNQCIHKTHPIIITIVDKYYKNLPLLKGEIHLWQKNI